METRDASRGGQALKALALLRIHLAGRKAALAGLGFAILASNGLKLASPLVLRSFIDAIVRGAGMEELLRPALAFIGLAAGTQVLALAATWLGQDLGWKATDGLRLDLLRRGLDLDMGFHREHLPGELIERVDGDAKTLMSFFSDFSLRLLGSAALMAGILVTLFLEDPRVGAAMLLFAAFASVFLLKVGMVAVPAWTANRAMSAEFHGFLEERIAGREDLKSLGATAHAGERLRGMLRAWFPVRLKANLLAYTMWTSSELVAGLGMILSLGLGAALWRAGAISLGTVFLVWNYAELIRQPLEQLREELEELQKALAGAARILEFLEFKPAMSWGIATFRGAEGRGAEGSRQPAAELEFRGVSFAYEPGAPVLRGVDFRVEAGSSLGVVGRTGSGKTTVGRLALRLHEAGEGQVLLDGRPIGDYSREALRRRLAVVTQEVELVSGSIRDNVGLWDPGLSDEAILSAFGELRLEPWLARHPEGLDRRMGPGGTGLSAGEAQLLAMVRVFLRDPGLVILDEASSRLDPATEALIDGALGRLLAGRTAIIIAHRLSTLRRVEGILVMEAGRVLESGPRVRLEADPESRWSRLLRAGESPAAERPEEVAP